MSRECEKKKKQEEELAKETQSGVREVREEPEKSNEAKTETSKGENGQLSQILHRVEERL